MHDSLSTHPERGIFCNRTLNLRSIKAIGYDMDYTLIHYDVKSWEGHAYQAIKQRLLDEGWDIAHLEFDHDLATRGLIIDRELGNVLKTNRFGYIKRVYHGTQQLEYKRMRKAYSRTLVDLADPRYYFLNTLFSISEACIYMQLVDLLDQGKLSEVIGYTELFQHIRATLDHAHVEGQLKAEIIANPDRFVDIDPDVALTLLDQKCAGKQLMLITNSEWEYTKPMMEFAIEPYLPQGMRWRELFDLVVVSSRKPDFFSTNAPSFELVSDDGLLRPAVGLLQQGKTYVGGNASLIERSFGISGDELLYVGDHIFSDVNITKSLLRWRTALIVRELEEELIEIDQTRTSQIHIQELMQKKEQIEAQSFSVRLGIQRIKTGIGPQPEHSLEDLQARTQDLQNQLTEVDEKIGPVAAGDGRGFNPYWGFLMRTGNDKSNITRQIEKYADIYTSRVSNFLHYTPYMYFRSPRGSLPHDTPPSK